MRGVLTHSSVMMHQTKQLGLVVAAVLVVGCNATQPTTAVFSSIEVVEVIDGDTIRARVAGTTETIRLVGVDTPETKHPTKGVQCFGPQATEFLAKMLPVGTTLRIERDQEARDAFGRLLLYLFRPVNDGEWFVNVELVRRGYGKPLHIEPNSRYRDAFVTGAFEAQRNQRGLWKWCK